jgi:hypothetical protein
MRLTVGELPPAVYWRRRVVVLAALLLAVLALVYSCAGGGGSGGSGTGGGNGGAGLARGRSPVPNLSDSASVFSPPPGTGLGDDGGGGPPTGGNQPADATATPAVTPGPQPSGPCTDDEMAISAAADPSTANRAAFVKFTLRIRNTSSRSCTRDVGADPQELYLQDGNHTKIWSSDTCDAQHGSDVRMFRPNDVAEFYIVWNGKANNSGCNDGQPPAAGTYQLFGRLANKLSPPGPLVVK